MDVEKHDKPKSIISFVRGRLSNVPWYNKKFKTFQKVEGLCYVLVEWIKLGSYGVGQCEEWKRCKRFAFHYSMESYTDTELISILTVNRTYNDFPREKLRII